MVAGSTAQIASIIDRLVEASPGQTVASLADLLGVKPQSVYNAKYKGRIPDSWFARVARGAQVSVDFLIKGEGILLKTETEEPVDSETVNRSTSWGYYPLNKRQAQQVQEVLPEFEGTVIKDNNLLKELVELRGEVKVLRQENRELNAELRDALKKVSSLQLENANLKSCSINVDSKGE